MTKIELLGENEMLELPVDVGVDMQGFWLEEGLRGKGLEELLNEVGERLEDHLDCYNKDQS